MKKVALIVALIVCGTAESGRAQVRLGPAGPVRVPADGPDKSEAQLPDNQLRVRTLKITPAAESRPALKYSLLIETSDRQPGNAVPFYYRAFGMMAEIATEHRVQLGNLVDQPYEKLQAADTHQLLGRFERVLESLEIATMRQECNWDWQLERMIGPASVQFLLPELQSARDVARLLAVRAQWQIYQGDYDGAAATLRMGYQLARDVSRPTIMISGLVGIAITSVMNQELMHWIQQPGSPSLYWPIAELPRPFIDLREAMRTELSWPRRLFPQLNDAETTERTSEQWQSLYAELAHDLAGYLSSQESTGNESVASKQIEAQSMITGLIMNGYPRARQALSQEGFTLEQLDAMPVGQVVAIFQTRRNRELADELYKALLLPYAQAWPLLENSQRPTNGGQNYKNSKLAGREILPIASLLMPAVSSARRAEARCWSELNALQSIEAIRLYAAINGRKFPSTLAALPAETPAPVNPIDNQPFPYHVTAESAVLTAPAPPNMSQSLSQRIELTLIPGEKL